jgi:1,4-alpha-glucan branching enzyme
MHADPELEVMTGLEYLAANSPETAITLPEGSWGLAGGHYVWSNPQVAWIWQRIWDAEKDMRSLLCDCGYGHDEAMRALVQLALRQLLLLQASDWPFLITTGGAADYASERVHSHHSDFKRVAELARRYARGDWIAEEEWAFVSHLQDRDRPFADIDPAWFAEVQNPA